MVDEQIECGVTVFNRNQRGGAGRRLARVVRADARGVGIVQVPIKQLSRCLRPIGSGSVWEPRRASG
jgi:hypothetical protein